MKQQDRFRRLAVRVGELHEQDVIGVGFQLFHTLWNIQHKIRSDCELSLFEFLQATIDSVCIPVYEKNPQQSRSVGLCRLCGGIPRATLLLPLIPL